MPSLRWQPLTTLTLSLAGLAVSVYLTITHFHKAALVCASNGTINCEKVTTSPQSELLGIPVAMLGLAFFAALAILCLPRLWRSPARLVHQARLALSITGVMMVLYLISAELFAVKAICLWCTAVHVITFILFVIIAVSTPTVLDRDYADSGESDAKAAYDTSTG
jgi:uncharacterized membrane protein